MNPRDSIEFFRILGHVTSLPEEHEIKYHLGSGFGMILMCVLKVGRPDLYKSLGKEGAPHEEIARIFKQGFEQHYDAQRFFFLYSTSFEDRSFVYKVLHSEGLLDEEDTKELIQNKFNNYNKIWVHLPQNRYLRFYKSIEAAELI